MADGAGQMQMRSERRAGLRAGMIASLPIIPATVPFGFIFGAVAAEAGLDLVQAGTMAALVVAAASQLAAVQMLSDGAPVAVIVLTGAVINLRLAMYSASLLPHLQGATLLERTLIPMVLHDQAYAVSIARYRERREGPAARVAFFLGAGAVSSALWLVAVVAGFAGGTRLPEGIEFFIPIAFLALAAPMLRDRPSMAAAATAVAVAVALRHLPYSGGLFIASAAGIGVGMLLSRGEAP